VGSLFPSAGTVTLGRAHGPKRNPQPRPTHPGSTAGPAQAEEAVEQRQQQAATTHSNKAQQQCTAIAKLYTESGKLHPKQLTRVPIHAGQLLCPPMTRCSLQYGALTWLHLPTGGGNTSFGNSRCGPLLACTALLLLLHLAISCRSGICSVCRCRSVGCQSCSIGCWCRILLLFSWDWCRWWDLSELQQFFECSDSTFIKLC